nr:CidA/LrgA family holin-like protein [Bacillus sp. FJAT-49711]
MTVKIVKTILQIALLYFIFLLGSWIQKTLNLFIPGSIIGMLILYLLLSTGFFKQEWIEKGSVLLIKYLPLLFLPVTVGIISFPQLFNVQGILLILIILFSTALVMVSTGILSQQLLRKRRYENE